MRQGWLLLTLGASLVGFFLLLNLLVPLVSTGPQDILAVKPSDEDAIRLPSGVTLLAFGVAAMSIVLGVGALVALQGWPLQRHRMRPSPRLLTGVLAAVALIGLGAYLAFSGTLGQEISYDQHQAERALLQPIGLAVLSGFFLSVVIVGILNPRLLLPVLGGWLAAGIVFGLLNTQSLDGLRLFEKASRLEEPVEYNVIVERYLRVDEGKESDAGLLTSPGSDALGSGGVSEPAPRVLVGYLISLDPGVTTEQTHRLAHEPIFSVAGAANTSFLRAATGDIYADGRWGQLDPVYIPISAETRVLSRMADFVSSPTPTEHSLNVAVLKPATSSPPEVPQDLIVVSPTGDIAAFVGSLAISQNLAVVDFDATYRPFSVTLGVDQPLTRYGWKSSIVTYSPDALIGASPTDDPAYLQLPDDLPQRVHDLAAEIATDDSPYLRARAIEGYLRENYTLAFAQPGSQPARPPAGQDPVDWFLFDHGEGSHGNFSTAFVVLARAAGVPARVVSGWAISASAEQTVHWDQAHQWAEIALDGLGWITFDPAPGESPGERRPSSETVPSSEGAPLGETGPLKDKGDSIAPPPAQDLEAKESPVTDEALEAALEDLLASEDPQVRTFVLQVLGESADPEPLRVLIRAMFNEGEVGDRLEGVTALEALDLDLLTWILLKYGDPAIRVAAADALGDLGDLRALEALFQALAADLFPGVRGASANALAALGDASASGPLTRALQSDGNGLVRAAAAEALGVLKPPGIAALLIEALGADPDERVRAAAARALGRIRDDAALAPLLEAEMHDDLRAVREAARDALSEWPVFALVAALQGSPHPEARASAAEILGRFGYASAIPALSRAVGDREEAVRSAALEALHRLGTMLPLENGGALLFRGNTQIAFIPGATAVAAPQGPVRAAFNVTGADRTTLLRTATGDHYVDGRWMPQESTGQPHTAVHEGFDHTRALVQSRQSTDVLDAVLLSMPDSMTLLGGAVPTSSQLNLISVPGVFWPESAVYTTGRARRGYSWTSWVTNYSAEELRASTTVASDLHTSLPEDLPQRVLDLAVEITAQHSGPYRKAAAIERHLKENYTYAQADATEERPPEGHDPVDWFLFESGVGTSGNFSSAFVILARSVGIPARVVSGWAIAPIADRQEVYSDQAHQWTEVPFLDRGWVPFDPTSGGAPSRAFARLGSLEPEIRAAAIEGQLEHLADGDATTKGTARELLDALLQSSYGKHPSLLEGLSAGTLSVSRETEALRLLDDLLRSLGRQGSSHTPFTLASLEALSRELTGLEPGTREPSLSALAKLLESLSSDRPTAPAGAREAFGDLLEVLSGSDVIRLETGGVLIRQGRAGGQGQSPYHSFSVGTGAHQATEPPHIPVFEVRGAANTPYLRTGVGDVYEHGRWAQQDPASIPYPAGGSTYDLLREVFYTLARDDLQLPGGPFEPALLFGPQTAAPRTVRDRIEVLPTGNATRLPAGSVPTSPTMQSIDRSGVLHPYSATFSSEAVVASYSWVSSMSSYSDQQLARARAVYGLACTDLPDDLPGRIRTLAQQITAGHATAYGKAKALERYLSTQYTYRFARTAEEGRPPPGRDPVDWFLFESGVGTSGNFSSAFVLMARSVGIPARVVSGWAIAPIADRQEVYSDQAHQWAEVAFEGLGWVSFEPTASGGAPSRAAARLGSSDPEVRAAAIEGQLEQLADGDATAAEAARELLAGVLNSISDKHSSTLREVSATADAARRQAGNGGSAPHGEALRLLNNLLDSLIRQSPTDPANSLARLESLVRDLSNLDQAQRERALPALAKLLESLTGDGLTASARSQEALGDLLEVLSGSDVIRLETGGVLIRQGRAGGQGQSPGYHSLSVGTSAHQATEPPHIPVFEVRGAANTPYLRTGVGDVYEHGRWAQQDPASIPYPAGGSTYDLLREVFYTPARDDLQLPGGPFEPALLFGPQTAAPRTVRDRIEVLPTGNATRLPAGSVPTSPTMQSIDRSGVLHPYSATFSSEAVVASYSWVSSMSSYSDQQLARARAVYGLAYTDLPDDLPGRIRTLAQQITAGHATAYGKAKALERYLSTQYTYRFARTAEEGRPPPGHDPVDWFLFDHREGTCGVFSSAFVVLARSIGLPARVVSGWAIAQTADTQIVYVDQAHQWAEVAFEGLGWVSFEPTASGGAPSRVEGAGSGSGATTSGPEEQPPQDTVTNITQSPAEISRGQAFFVRGTVHTAAGIPVSGVTVEVYVNETKEHGGTKIGTTVTRFGTFQASVEIPTEMELGSYQLLARAVANEDFYESWSDPDITVYSSSGLELTSPAEVPVDVEAVFHGKVLDDTGKGVADRQVNVTIDGRAGPPVTTSPTGTFSFSRTFSAPGGHWVAVEVKGQEYLLDNQVRLDFQVTLPTDLTLLAPALVSVNEAFTVNGELRDVRGEPLAGEYVSVSVGDDPEVRALTDGSGAFQVDGRTDSAGEFVVQATFSGLAPTLPSEEATRLTARHMVSLSLSGPSQIDTGSGALFTGRLTSDTLSPIGDLELSIEDGEGSRLATVTTDEDGRFEYNHASFDVAGRYSLTARFPGGEFVGPRSARVNFAVVSPTTLTIEGPAVQRDGQRFEVTGVVMQGSGAVFTGGLASATVSPIGRRELSIRDGNGRELATVTTSEDGAFEYRHPSFDTAGSHSLTVRFSGGETLGPQSSSITFGVLSPTTLTLEEPAITGSGQPVEAVGFLLQGSGALFTGRLMSDTVSPIGRRELSIRDGDGRALATVTTSEDGTFEYEHPAFEATGPHSVTIRFSGTDFLAPQSTGTTFGVLALTALTLEEPNIVREGQPFELRGVLLRGSGLPVANATVRVTSGDATLLVTDADGRFTWEAVGRLNDSSAEAVLESELDVEAVFEGADHLAPARASTTVTVGAPRIVMGPVDTVARGDSVPLRGTALIGNYPSSEVAVSIGEDTTVQTNEAGVFSYTYPVTENTPLGITEVAIAADGIDAVATAAIEVKSAPSLIVTPVDKVQPGRATVLQVTLVDDRGTGIAQATLRSSQGVTAVTDAEGVALMELTVPDSHELPSVPITFNYDGDDLNMPLSYFLGVPITPTSFNWLLWAGAPLAVLLVIAAVLAGRRVGTAPLPVLVRQRLAAPAPEPVAVPVAATEEPTDEEVIEELQPTHLEVRFIRPAHDLPDVWGVGEEVAIEIELSGDDGQAIGGTTLAIAVSGGGPETDLVADDAGVCTLRWTPAELGEYTVSASFGGDDERQEASGARSLRVVDFREEIVRLYNEFLDWAKTKTPAVSEQSTPREVELTLVTEGLRVDQKSLDELISRFEEADYSEHPVVRRHYERMYRAWRTIVRD